MDANKKVELALDLGGNSTELIEDEKSNDISPPKCICGQEMKYKESDESVCDACQYSSGKNNFYKCEKNKFHPKQDYDICIQCSKHINKYNNKPIKEMHDKSLLYFIYNDNKIQGPFTINKIITLYITNRLKEDKLHIRNAEHTGDWHKLTFPQYIYLTKYHKMEGNDKKRLNFLSECEEMNKKIKIDFPDLYENLVENVIRHRLKQIEMPNDIPNEAKRSYQSSSFIFATKSLGRAIAILASIIILIHILPTLCASCCIVCCICILAAAFPESQDKLGLWFWGVMLFFGYSGIFIIPIAINYYIITREYSGEIQSWMISYITWGIISYLSPISYFISELIMDKPPTVINDVILLIIGIDFGPASAVFNLSEIEDVTTGFSITFLFPSTASIVGFVANFILENKFDLKCSEDIVSDVCFNEEYGCCDVISSHDWKNMYGFMGGLASNILASWAIIRIIGYLLVSAFPSLSVYAKRTK